MSSLIYLMIYLFSPSLNPSLGSLGRWSERRFQWPATHPEETEVAAEDRWDQERNVKGTVWKVTILWSTNFSLLSFGMVSRFTPPRGGGRGGNPCARNWSTDIIETRVPFLYFCSRFLDFVPLQAAILGKNISVHLRNEERGGCHGSVGRASAPETCRKPKSEVMSFYFF